VKPTEHARDFDRLGQVDVQDGLRRHALPDSLVSSALVRRIRLLGTALARRVGLRYPELIETRHITPLGMRDS